MICDSVLSKAQDMKMSDAAKVRNGKLDLLDRLHGMLTTMDSNDDGRVDADELKKAIKMDREELVLMLDTDGDGKLSYDNFIRSFYRLIDGGDFQQLCIMQMSINHHMVEMKQHSTTL